ncbi:MAG: hypothetical protein A2X82_02340 [Geobacteraceae bacterium GWC2_55_20]|nr:MAG: hypothetical protein A2X82_02340 [Geobacteraceae bacterium GWC2_55_20]OGU20235.1 MAG: hypothetical protein A2X85_06790 [Geobacteraceae bacterium GWF2_54_21]HBA72254.1 hypothetical protein [Geobacter sp.]HCE67635.1 hypothetical protein [Geobacter sp.]
MKQKKQIKRKSINLPKHLQNLNPYAAGIDIGSKSHFVAVPVQHHYYVACIIMVLARPRAPLFYSMLYYGADLFPKSGCLPKMPKDA